MTIYLREIERADILELNRWRHNKNIIDLLASPFRYINTEIEEKWFENYMSSRSNNIRLSICEATTNKMLGLVYLLRIDWLNRSCEYAIQIGDASSLGRGFGYQATLKILEHAFNDLNLHRVYLTVLENNERAINLYRKIGFIEEGIHRKAVYKNGLYFNLIHMAILASEYQFKNQG